MINVQIVLCPVGGAVIVIESTDLDHFRAGVLIL